MKTTRSGLTTLALTTVALAAVSGCGGSKELSRSELIAKADPICRRANAAIDHSKFNVSNVAQLAPGMAAAQNQASAELAKLTPPSSMAADWKVIVDGYRRTGTGIQRAGEAARSAGSANPLTHSKAFAEAATEFANGREVRQTTAARNGFIDCAKF